AVHGPTHEHLEVVGGDAFAGVPTGCDTYLFVNVLHDWDDEHAIALLKQAHAVLPPNGRILIVEGERRRRPLDDIAARTDMLMLALTPGGHERSPSELAALARVARL